MKRFFMLAAAACAVVFMGCSKDDEGTAGDLAGMWADTFESDGETHAVDIYEIKGNKMTFRHCTNLSEIYEPIYKDGTLSSDKEAIFELYESVNISVSGDQLSIGGLMNWNITKISSDKIQVWDAEDPEDVMTWQRIHNTENIVFK